MTASDDPLVIQLAKAAAVLSRVEDQLEDERADRQRETTALAVTTHKLKVANRVLAGFVVVVVIGAGLFINAHRNAIDRIQDTRAANQTAACSSYNVDTVDVINGFLDTFLTLTPAQEARLPPDVRAKLAKRAVHRNCTPDGIADYYADPQGPNAYTTTTVQGG